MTVNPYRLPVLVVEHGDLVYQPRRSKAEKKAARRERTRQKLSARPCPDRVRASAACPPPPSGVPGQSEDSNRPVANPAARNPIEAKP